MITLTDHLNESYINLLLLYYGNNNYVLIYELIFLNMVLVTDQKQVQGEPF